MQCLCGKVGLGKTKDMPDGLMSNPTFALILGFGFFFFKNSSATEDFFENNSGNTNT